jgi:hypothetical protein
MKQNLTESSVRGAMDDTNTRASRGNSSERWCTLVHLRAELPCVSKGKGMLLAGPFKRLNDVMI